MTKVSAKTFGRGSKKRIQLRKTSSSKWRVTVSGELMFLESYGNFDVTNTVTLLTKEFLVTISDKHYDSPAAKI